MGLSAGLAWVGVSSCGTFAEGWERVDDCAHTNEPPPRTSQWPCLFLDGAEALLSWPKTLVETWPVTLDRYSTCR